MPDVTVGAQIFDLAFHPTEPTVYTGLLTGAIKAFRYDDQGNCDERFSLRPSKRSCRGLAVNHDGNQLCAVGKGKSIYTVDTATGNVVETRKKVHEAPINRVKYLTPGTFATGDDDGVIKLWDPRKPDGVRTYTQHFDYITDFLWLEDNRQLVATSADGTLSVMDVRSKKAVPLAQSEDQEDELLSVVTIRGGTKVVVGTQLGILSIFNRSKGWGDCVDRVPGHPHSVDTICTVPSAYDPSGSAILTGSSDGIIRAVSLFPTKLMGVVAQHGAYPVERMAVDRGGEGQWLASAGHEEVLRMTDLKNVFEEWNGENQDPPEDEEESGQNIRERATTVEGNADARADLSGGDDSDVDAVVQKKRKRKRQKDVLDVKKKKGRNEVDADASFFAGL